MDMTHNKCCRHGANLRRRRRRRGKILRFIIFSCSIIAVTVFVAVGSSMIRSGDGRTNRYDVEARNNTYDNAVIENSKISEKNKIQNNQSMLDDIMNSTQYPKQLKDLALKNEEALEFVYDYPAEHVKEHTIDLTEEASMDSVPLFVQWDKRWGYEKYSGNFFAASGCGPTTLSMVVVYLTHNRDASPIAVAKYSKEAGYSVDGSGSSWTIISEGCRHYGVKAKTVALDESRMKAEGYQCERAFDGKEGADKIEQNRYDLLLLDIMLPEINGYELLDYVRRIGDTPVIIISAMGQVDERIRGLRMGADDYICKPFQIGELLARVETVLRRTQRMAERLEIDDVAIDPKSRTVTKAGEQVELTAKEFDLLYELMKNKNVALSRRRLYELVWQEEYTGETRTLDSHVQRLRKKLDWNQKIVTVFRIGYRLEVRG